MKISALLTALILALPLAAQSTDTPKRDQVRKQDGTGTGTGTKAQLRKRDGTGTGNATGTGTGAQLRKRDGTGTGTCSGTGSRGASQGARKGRGR